MNDLIPIDQPPLSPEDLLEFEGEVRIQDLRLAEALGFAYPVDIRKLIRRHKTKLERHGLIFATVAKFPGQSRGPAGKVFYLNERQAYRLCMVSDAPNAELVQDQMIEVFVAWRHGKLAWLQNVPVDPEALPLPDEYQADYLTSQGTRFFEECIRVFGTDDPAKIAKELAPLVSENKIRAIRTGGSVTESVAKSAELWRRLVRRGFDEFYIFEGIWQFTPFQRALIEHIRALPKPQQAQLMHAIAQQIASLPNRDETSLLT